MNLDTITRFFKELGVVKLAGIAVAALALIIIAVVYVFKAANNKMSVLYADLDQSDSSKIVQELELKKIPYELLADGAMIKVPSDVMLRTRLSMAENGLPNGGGVVGYEIFNNEESLGTTNFLQNVKMVRALEGELSRTITSFEQIDRARVHLVIPQREVFSREKQEPRASIVLKLKGHKKLGNGEVDAIGHLVVTAVPGLEMKSITIVDTKGRSLKINVDESQLSMLSGSNAEDFRQTYEHRLQNDIEKLLEKSLGPESVKAKVSIDINFDRIVTNSETYDPEGAVIRSTQTVEEHERTPLGGASTEDVSVANNVPGSTENTLSTDVVMSNEIKVDRVDETTNYEISKTISNKISETGNIEKLSIAILVDGNYDINPETKEKIYNPRSPEELKKIENLVKVAVGFDAKRGDKIEVINMQFFAEEAEVEEKEKTDWYKDELPTIFRTVILAIVVVLAFIVVLRPIVNRIFADKKDHSNIKMGGISIASSGGGEDDMSKEMKQRVENVSKVNEVISSHPQETLMVLRQWLNGK